MYPVSDLDLPPLTENNLVADDNWPIETIPSNPITTTSSSTTTIITTTVTSATVTATAPETVTSINSINFGTNTEMQSNNKTTLKNFNYLVNSINVNNNSTTKSNSVTIKTETDTNLKQSSITSITSSVEYDNFSSSLPITPIMNNVDILSPLDELFNDSENLSQTLFDVYDIENNLANDNDCSDNFNIDKSINLNQLVCNNQTFSSTSNNSQAFSRQQQSQSGLN